MKTLENHFEIKIQEFFHFLDIKNQSFLNSRAKLKTLMVTLFFRLKRMTQNDLKMTKTGENFPKLKKFWVKES